LLEDVIDIVLESQQKLLPGNTSKRRRIEASVETVAGVWQDDGGGTLVAVRLNVVQFCEPAANYIQGDWTVRGPYLCITYLKVHINNTRSGGSIVANRSHRFLVFLSGKKKKQRKVHYYTYPLNIKVCMPCTYLLIFL